MCSALSAKPVAIQPSLEAIDSKSLVSETLSRLERQSQTLKKFASF
jgi:hypothetical protein